MSGSSRQLTLKKGASGKGPTVVDDAPASAC